MYTVTFDTDGGSTEPAQVIAHGSKVIEPANNPTKTGYNFINWYEDSNYQTVFDFTNTTITGPITIYAKFEIKTFTVTFDTDGGSSVPSQTVNYGGTVTRPASNPTKTGYTFDDWYEDSGYQTEFDFANTTITEPTTIYAKFVSQSSTITVSFDVDGGTTVSPITITRGDSINDLPITSKQDYYFLGWYLDLSDPYPVSEPFTPTETVELKAKWQKVLCKKATTLTSVECHSDSNKGCRLAGYNDGDIVTYGNIIQSDTYTGGDALLCDVDGTGYNKRFYYMRTLNGNAVLMYDRPVVLSGDPDGQNYTYDTALTVLPDATTWSNLPVKFENNTKASRFPTVDDTKAAIGSDNVTSNSSIASAPYIFENVDRYSTHSGADTVWLNEIVNGETIYRYRYHVNSLAVIQIEAARINTSMNCVKPVIEVPLDLIEDDYVIRYNPVGGTIANEYVRVKKGTALGTLPTAIKTGYVFDDWYTSLQYTTSIDENKIPNNYDTYYAKWLLDLNNAVIPDESYVLGVGDEDNIDITSLDVEPVTYTSNDTSVVTVDSTGHMVAVSEGTTTITITGSLSGHTRTINIRVATVLTDFVVSFDSQGGTPVGDMSVPRNTAIGSLPSPDPTLTNYVFGGWYTNTSYTTKVTVDTIIRADVTFYAKWIPDDAVAEVNIGTYYTSLSTAITSASTGDTITIVKDISSSPSIDIFTDLTIDLNGHTLQSSGRALQIYSKVELKNGTITTSGSSGAVDVVTDSTHIGELTMNSGSVIATGSKQGIYVNGGIARIGGTAYISSKADGNSNPNRSTVQCLGGGTVIIIGGTIINERSSNSYAVATSGGTVIIGTEDNAYDATTPVIKGNTNGLKASNNAKYSIYDGIIMGKSAAVDSESNIEFTESGSTKVTGNDGTYYYLYYTLP